MKDLSGVTHHVAGPGRGFGRSQLKAGAPKVNTSPAPVEVLAPRNEGFERRNSTCGRPWARVWPVANEGLSPVSQHVAGPAGGFGLVGLEVAKPHIEKRSMAMSQIKAFSLSSIMVAYIEVARLKQKSATEG